MYIYICMFLIVFHLTLFVNQLLIKHIYITFDRQLLSYFFANKTKKAQLLF